MTYSKKVLNDSAIIRWSVLLLISLMMFGSYYFYDAYSGIKSVLQKELLFSNNDYGTMVANYSFTNSFLLMTIFGGVILDQWGIRKTGFLFVLFMSFGAFLTAYGTTSTYVHGGFGYGLMDSFMKSWSPALKMMVLGRILFGLGAETVNVVISKMIVKWFKGKELALAFGINLAIARFGTAAALIISPKLVESADLSTASWFGAVLVIIAILVMMVYWLVDLKFDKQVNIDLVDQNEKFKMKDVWDLVKDPAFIYITILCVTFYSAVFPFMSYAADFLHNKFGFSLQASGTISTILPYGTVVFTPLFGFVADKFGKSASLMMLGSLLLIFVHASLALTSFPPYLALFVLGVAFSLVPAAMWPAVSKIASENKLGTAYGIMFTIQNLGLYLFPWLVGVVLDGTNKGVTAAMADSGAKSYDYTYALLMLCLLGFVGFFFAYLLKQYDKKKKLGLELPS